MVNDKQSIIDDLAEDAANDAENRMLGSLLNAARKRRRNRAALRIGTSVAVLVLVLAPFIPNRITDMPESVSIIRTSSIEESLLQPEVESVYTVFHTEKWIPDRAVAHRVHVETVILDDAALIEFFPDRPLMIAESSDGSRKQLVFLDSVTGAL